MKILLLSTGNIEEMPEGEIYSDLIRELNRIGHEINVICTASLNGVKRIDRIKILTVSAGNLKSGNFIKKGLAILFLNQRFIRVIKKHLQNSRYDLLIYSTPPITISRVINYCIKKWNCATYLMLKDIFPQNAVDLQLMKKNSFIYKYFRFHEMKAYSLSDHIGCMSKANVEYVKKNNNWIPTEKIEICPNSIRVFKNNINEENRKKIRSRLSINEDAVVFIFGGNLGKPQGIDFLLQCIYSCKDTKKAYFLIIGKGTEFKRIDEFIINNKLKNVLLLDHMDRKEYDNLLHACDVGVILLDKRFTIPNFPSRILAYMLKEKPVIAATDPITDLKDSILEGGFGLWSPAGDMQGFKENVLRLIEYPDLRETMGQCAFNYLKNNYDVKETARIILQHFSEMRAI